MSEDYEDFLRSKQVRARAAGFEPGPVPSLLFDWQGDVVRWTVRQGRAAIFAGCGLGKTGMQLAWADQVARHTQRPVLVLTPLAVAPQTVEEATKFGMEARIVARQSEVPSGPSICVTNYQKLLKNHFDPEAFGDPVADSERGSHVRLLRRWRRRPSG